MIRLTKPNSGTKSEVRMVKKKSSKKVNLSPIPKKLTSSDRALNRYSGQF